MYMFNEPMPDCVPEYYRSQQEDEEHEYELRMERQEIYRANRRKIAAVASGFPVLDYGGYEACRDCPRLKEMMDRFDRELQSAISGDETSDGFVYEMFLYELGNHEYGYTGDLSETLYALGYTKADIQADHRLRHGLEKAQQAIWGD